METRIGGECYHLYGLRSSELSSVRAANVEWSMSDWRWDGDRFVANPLNSTSAECKNRQFFSTPTEFPVAGNSSNSSSSFSDELHTEAEKDQRDIEKRRRVTVFDDDKLKGEPNSLTLKLGGHAYLASEREHGDTEETNAKKAKLGQAIPNRAVCQVEDCDADLTQAKDYHRRHKVCEVHSKATKALVGNILQRFCQQCSRFHVLQEFDEGKRSCRRRLAGHNKRRRKTQPEAVADGFSIKDDQSSGYLLVTLLKLLSNLHSNKGEQVNDQDIISHLLRSLLSQNPKGDGLSGRQVDIISSILSGCPQSSSKPDEQGCRHPQNVLLPSAHHEDDGGDGALQFSSKSESPKTNGDDLPTVSEARHKPTVGKLNNFDLNDAYIDLDESAGGTEVVSSKKSPETSHSEYPSSALNDSNPSSPPQGSGHSDSACTRSPSSSGGDGQSRTGRIVFKLFGKQPAEFPVLLRGQILDWLSHSPTDIESYIRPGCIILTIYVRMPDIAWRELSSFLGSSLTRLVSLHDAFWGTGWVYVRVQDQAAFIYNGQVVLDTSLPISLLNEDSEVVSVKPIAVSAFGRAEFTVKGSGFLESESLLCAVEGSYLVPEFTGSPEDRQHLSFSCTIPVPVGRGFIEMEDPGLGSSFFPFLVAEEDVCSEIRMLERLFDSDGSREEATAEAEEAMCFVQEMGWLLHRCQFSGPSDCGAFSLTRFVHLVEYALDHDWCAVVRKLLDVLFAGVVDSEGHGGSLLVALSEMRVLHRAVRRNNRPLVELLIKYVPSTDGIVSDGFLFTPDVPGPGAITPLHIAAGRDGAAGIVDALTDDPGLVGVKAWREVKDAAGFTPEDYARLRGHYSYLHLVQRKALGGHVVVDVHDAAAERSEGPAVVSPLEVASSCKLCSRKVGVRRFASKPLVYRPAMLSMVAIAAVCVCVALLMKSLPEVLYVFRPFRWELLAYGAY